MIVVDTSVWSLALRRRQGAADPRAERLAAVLKQGQPVALLGIILQEILQGIRDSKRFEQIRDALQDVTMVDLEREDYVAAAELRNTCARHGVQASTIDSQIAAACVRHDCALLTSDRDFELISQWCPLQLL